MPANLFNPALESFHNDLGRIEKLIKLTDTLKEFGDVTPPDNIEGEFVVAAAQLREDVRKSSAVFPVLSGTLLLYISGRFENFVRATFETLCDMYAAKCKKFEELPDKMQSGLIYYTAMVMPNPKKFGFDSIQAGSFIQKLSENMSPDIELGDINSKCLSITEANMSSSMMHDLFSRASLTTIWQEIGKQTNLKMHFELSADGDVTIKAKKVLDDIMGIRNKIAHPNGEPEFPDASAVLNNIEYLKILASEIVNCCAVQVTTFKPIVK
jgi:hypothetical protein